jgi:hypothetical protein
MKTTIMTIVLLLTFAVASAAAPFGSTPPPKVSSQVPSDADRHDGREGGETIEDAVAILELPFHDTGRTTDNAGDYPFDCPWGCLGPDVVYSFQATEDVHISVDLCLSSYDTAVSVLDQDLQLVDCNDDYYHDDPCGIHTSFIGGLFVPAGATYYIIVGGYGSLAGNYDLVVAEDPPEPTCELICDGMPEDEPPLEDGYDDQYNSGCNGSIIQPPFQALMGDASGDLLFCGRGGWFDVNHRDTDWFTAIIGPDGRLEWTVEAERPTTMYLLGPQDCAFTGILDSVELPECEPGTMVIQGQPGEVLWLWVGATEFSPPSGMIGHEYTYVANFRGLEPGVVAVNPITFDGIKSLYR